VTAHCPPLAALYTTSGAAAEAEEEEEEEGVGVGVEEEEVGGGTIYDLHALMAPAWDYLIVRETGTLRVVAFQSYTHHRHMQ
jgi:hypothetical protein